MASAGNPRKLFIINFYQKQLGKALRQKRAKKGLLIKIMDANRKRSEVLDSILKESSNLDTLNMAAKFASTQQHEQQQQVKSDEEFLKKYYQTPKGGPKHSIAEARAHHLTSFLTEYVLNAFQSGAFLKPDVAAFKKEHKSSVDDHELDYAFEISHVELLADLSALKIHWLNSGHDELDLFVENYLQKQLSAHIRQTLSNQRVMNYVPRVVFVRDPTNANMKKIDECLRQIKLENRQNDIEEENAACQSDQVKPDGSFLFYV